MATIINGGTLVIVPADDYSVTKYHTKYHYRFLRNEPSFAVAPHVTPEGPYFLVPLDDFQWRARLPASPEHLPRSAIIIKNRRYHIKHEDDTITSFTATASRIIKPHEIDSLTDVKDCHRHVSYAETKHFRAYRNYTLVKLSKLDLNHLQYFRQNDYGWSTKLDLRTEKLVVLDLWFIGFMKFTINDVPYEIAHDDYKRVKINCITNNVINLADIGDN